MNSQIVGPQKPGILTAFAKRIGWAIMLLLVALVTLFVSRYLTLDPDVFFPQQRAVYIAHLTILIVHIVGSMLALMIGPFQFLPGIRKGRWLKLHRGLGRTYLLSVLFGGLAGLYMAQVSYGGMVTHLGFSALAVSWLYSGYRAYRHIRNKEIEQHRQWMVRTYALTFAGVMLRLWMPLSEAAGFDFLMAYRAVAWLAWVPNLLVAEWMIRRSLPRRVRAKAVSRPEATVNHEAAQTDA